MLRIHKMFGTILIVIFLGIISFQSALAGDRSITTAIEINGQGRYYTTRGEHQNVAETMAEFEAKYNAVASAAIYFSQTGLIEIDDEKKSELLLLVADDLKVKMKSTRNNTKTKKSNYTVSITARIDVADFIRGEIEMLKLGQKEYQRPLRVKHRSQIILDRSPGKALATAYLLIRKQMYDMALIYIERLKETYPHWGQLHMAEAVAYFAQAELRNMKTSLAAACSYDVDQACRDLNTFKRLYVRKF